MKPGHLLLSALFLLGFAASAGEPFFVTDGNRTLYYERYRVGTGKVVQTTTLDFVDVRKVGNDREVRYGMTLRKGNGREMYGGRSLQTVQIEPDGDVRMDFGGTIKSIIQNMFPNAKVTCSGGIALMPAQMHPGDTLPDAHCEVTASGFKFTIDVTERSVLRKEWLTTPAGTFDCVVAREHKVERGPMHFKDEWSETWYAAGYGFIRHDNLDRKMRVETSEILISDTRN